MKTYLSKSNRANPDDVMQLRHDLIAIGDEIKEFKGGQWEASIISGNDRVICSHPANQDFTPEFCIMGRGQYTEADFAINALSIPVYVYHEGDIYTVTSIEKLVAVKESWMAYAKFNLGNSEILNKKRNENKGNITFGGL